MKTVCNRIILLVWLLPCVHPLQAAEHVIFPSEDGLPVTATVYAPHAGAETPVIVLFHQAGASRGEYLEIAPWLNRLGYNCLAVDQRSGGGMNGVVNQTAQRAENKNLPAGYIDALPDIRAALRYARKHYGERGVLAWGSSYSAALVLQLAGTSPGLADGVLAFSPGEYFRRAGKSATWIRDSARHIRVPVFIASARDEAGEWAAIVAAIESEHKVAFVPATAGRHGARALWSQYRDSTAYREAVQAFLAQYFPVGG